MQVAIDNAKRKFNINLTTEIPYIKNQMDIDKNGYPNFWLITKKDKRKARNDQERYERQKRNKEKIQKNVNKELICPMNYLYGLDLSQFRNIDKSIPMSEFFIRHQTPKNRYMCKNVEKLIQKYSFEIRDVKSSSLDGDDKELLLREDFDELIRDIRATYISKNYEDLMAWLINRTFHLSEQTRGNNNMQSILEKNRSLLLKVLYEVSTTSFLACFSRKIDAALTNDN